jgi:superfamily I DNA and/or RNA helicase
LCCTDSNAAADNFAAALLKRGIKCVRIGAGSEYKAAEHMRRLPGFKGYLKALGSPDETWRRLKLEKEAVEAFGVVVSTCIGSGHEWLQKISFPRVIIDECTQATLLSTFVPLGLGATDLALVGDHQQLPPTVLDNTSAQEGLMCSLFERLMKTHPDWSVMLDVQFRMHPSIAAFPSQEFYGNRITSHDSTAQLLCVRGIPWPTNGARVLLVDTHGFEQSIGSSLRNETEVDAILRLLPKVALPPSEIGVITPYQAQKSLIQKKLREAGFDGITVNTIDGFQGSERELILFSAVRCNQDGRIGFMQDSRRMNVALTRARLGVVVVASRRTLASSNHHARDGGCWFRWAQWMENISAVTCSVE